jgi:hypothetical protein
MAKKPISAAGLFEARSICIARNKRNFAKQEDWQELLDVIRQMSVAHSSRPGLTPGDDTELHQFADCTRVYVVNPRQIEFAGHVMMYYGNK